MTRFALALLLVTLTACGGGRDLPDRYLLRAESVAPAARQTKLVLKLQEPSSEAGIDTDRILVVDRPRHRTFYQGVRWDSPAPEMLQHYFADSFERSGFFKSVVTDASAARADWILETQLRAFEIDQSGPRAYVDIRVTATLLDATSRRTILSKPLSTRVDVTGKSLEGIIDAFNSALADQATELQQAFEGQGR